MICGTHFQRGLSLWLNKLDIPPRQASPPPTTSIARKPPPSFCPQWPSKCYTLPRQKVKRQSRTKYLLVNFVFETKHKRRHLSLLRGTVYTHNPIHFLMNFEPLPLHHAKYSSKRQRSQGPRVETLGARLVARHCSGPKTTERFAPKNSPSTSPRDRGPRSPSESPKPSLAEPRSRVRGGLGRAARLT